MHKTRCIDQLVKAFSDQRPIRAGSLIITLYGDAVAPRGGTAWLGSLIKLLEPLGLNQRLVRTSVFRLAKEGWLEAEQVGRRSYYSLTPDGRYRFDQACKRVYAPQQPDWDGSWCLILTSQMATNQRKTVREELGWHGFGCIAPGVLGHPMIDMEEVQAILQTLEADEDAIVLQAQPHELMASRPIRQLVQDCWDLEQLSHDYGLFLDKFRPIWQALSNASCLTPEPCFQVRILLIHEYRRLLLRDPKLPAALLPEPWEGTAAHLLCRNLYRLVQEQAEQHLSATLETAEGPLPEPASYFYRRFGGL